MTCPIGYQQRGNVCVANPEIRSASAAENLFTLELGIRPTTGISGDFSIPRRRLMATLLGGDQYRFGIIYRRFNPEGVNVSAGLSAVYGEVNGVERSTDTFLGAYTIGSGVGGMVSVTIGYRIFGNHRAALIGLLGLNVSAYVLTSQRDFVGSSNPDAGFFEVNPIFGFEGIVTGLRFGPFSNITGRVSGGYLWGQRIGESGITYQIPTVDLSAGVGW